jgi:hypothetical protein
MADNAARSRKTESWRAEAGLQPLQLSPLVHVVYVPWRLEHEVFAASQLMPVTQPPLTTPVWPPCLITHLVHVSTPAIFTEGQTLAADPVLHAMAWAEATRTVAKMAT